MLACVSAALQESVTKERRLEIVINSGESMRQLLSHLKAIWDRREVVYFLSLKDVIIRYKFSALGFLWAMIYPLGQMIILSVVFTLVVKFEIKAYPVFLLVGLLPWSFFTFSLTLTTQSMIDNSNIIKKVYFPRDIIPISQVLSNMFDYCVALLVLIPFLLFFGIGFSRQIVLLPLAIIIQIMLTTGVCLILSSLTVLYRDIKYLKELFVMLGFYASPVFYPATFVEENLGSFAYLAFHLNPMAGLLHIYRSIFYYQQWPNMLLTIFTIVISTFVLILGFKVFQTYERQFADLV